MWRTTTTCFGAHFMGLPNPPTDCILHRFDYSVEFLKWALTPPGYFAEWHVGVRNSSTKKLLAFITGVPAHVRVHDSKMMMAEINFLCVHKKLRHKRLAPVLIKEITRRVNLCNIWQAVYTAGVVLPRPLAKCRYWHRSINPKKLVEVSLQAVYGNWIITYCFRRSNSLL